MAEDLQCQGGQEPTLTESPLRGNHEVSALVEGMSKGLPRTIAVKSYWVNRFLLIMAGAAAPLGLVGEALGMRRAAAMLWATATAVTLAPLALSLVQPLPKRALGVDVIALLAMCGALALHEYMA